MARGYLDATKIDGMIKEFNKVENHYNNIKKAIEDGHKVTLDDFKGILETASVSNTSFINILEEFKELTSLINAKDNDILQ